MSEIIRLGVPEGGRYLIRKDGADHKISIGGGRGMYRTASPGAPLGAFALGDAQVGTANGQVLHLVRFGPEIRAVLSCSSGYSMVDGEARFIHPWSMRKRAAKAR